MSLNIKFSYLASNSKFSRSNSYFLILTPTLLRDGFLNSYFQNPSENSDGCERDMILPVCEQMAMFYNLSIWQRLQKDI